MAVVGTCGSSLQPVVSDLRTSLVSLLQAGGQFDDSGLVYYVGRQELKSRGVGSAQACARQRRCHHHASAPMSSSGIFFNKQDTY